MAKRKKPKNRHHSRRLAKKKRQLIAKGYRNKRK